MESRPYPLTFSVDYPDRPMNRLTTVFRIIVAIPILIIIAGIGGGTWEWSNDSSAGAAATGGLVVVSTALMIIFRQKYPRWWYDWNLELQRFINRVTVYLALMDDRYPSTDEQQSVHLDFPYPDVQRDLNRYMPLIKWLLAIPHYIALFFLNIAAVVVVVIVWFTILITGEYPRELFTFVEGVMRWNNRVIAYTGTFVTDQYPPFSLT